jgi:hypothetical protein
LVYLGRNSEVKVMNRISKVLAIILVITAVVFAGGCANKSSTSNNTTAVTPTEAIPTPTPTPSDPQLAISPDNKFSSVTIDNSPVKVNDKVTMKSILGDSYNISLNAYPQDENNLSVKIDEIEGVPFLSDKILKGDKQYVNVSIEVAPQCATGNYTILLKAIYHDITNQEYTTLDNIIVNVDHKSVADNLIDGGINLVNKLTSH